MFTGLSELTKGLNFYAIVFALVVGVTSVSWDGLTMLKAAMFMPTVAALLMLLVVTRAGSGSGRWRSWAWWSSPVRRWFVVGPGHGSRRIGAQHRVEGAERLRLLARCLQAGSPLAFSFGRQWRTPHPPEAVYQRQSGPAIDP
jgi:hypothetical protein